LFPPIGKVSSEARETAWLPNHLAARYSPFRFNLYHFCCGGTAGGTGSKWINFWGLNDLSDRSIGVGRPKREDVVPMAYNIQILKERVGGPLSPRCTAALPIPPVLAVRNRLMKRRCRLDIRRLLAGFQPEFRPGHMLTCLFGPQTQLSAFSRSPDFNFGAFGRRALLEHVMINCAQ
jgi:hypothetical protein